MISFKEIYRSSLLQAILIGIISFTQPGIWVALSNLGAGGLASVTTAYIATSVSYGLMVILAPPTAMFMNRYGIKPTLFIGCIGYVFYSAGLYHNSKTGQQWFVILGGFLCGISSAPLWQAEAVVALVYPEKGRKGLFIGIWQALNKTGSVIAGAIMVSLNINSNTTGKVSLDTYIILIALQATGILWAALISKPEKVIRKDGTKVITNVTDETIKQMWGRFMRIVKRKEILVLAPLMLTNSWYKTWQGNYMVHNFSVRSRSLNVLLAAVVSACADLFGTWCLDYPKLSNKVKARISWVFVACFQSCYFIWAFIAQKHIQDNNLTDLDWEGSPYYVTAYVPYQIFKVPAELVFNWVFWIVSVYSFDSADMSYVMAVVRGIESLGGVLSYVVGVVNDSDTTNLAVAAGAFWIVIPFATYVAWTVPEDNPEEESEKSSQIEYASQPDEENSVISVGNEKKLLVVASVKKVDSDDKSL